MRVNTEDLIMVGLVVVVALIGVVGVTEIVNQARVERRCLQHGYPTGDWRWIGPSYCIKRVDQTDTVVPLP